MKPEIVVMNFSHAYEEERFIRNSRFRWIDCTDIGGTSGYCDDAARREIARRISSLAPEGIHFIDSGNYHYVSKLWTDMIRHRFSLVLFDHHPDMQPPLFENMLSCGSWVKDMLDMNKWLDKVLIVGAGEELMAREISGYEDRIRFFSGAELSGEEGWREFSSLHISDPVYVSVDKDVLDPRYAATGWDQGSMPLPELESLLGIIFRNEKVIGVDVCGECSHSLDIFDEQRVGQINGHANAELLSLYLRCA